MKALTPQEIDELLAALPTLSIEEQTAILMDLEALETQERIERCRTDFLAFCAYVYDGFKEGPHHRHLRPILHDVNTGAQIRITVSMPPRFGKSETIAYLFVAWYLGHNPTHHIMMVTHTADLSASFGRKVRNLLDEPKYREIFPDTVVSRDKAAADNWTTTKGGKYLAIGIGGNVAGHGAHLLIADDLVSEQAVLANPDTAFENAWTYMQVGPLQRLMPGGRIVMIGCMTAETRVLMADGSEKELQHIVVGDQIATYDNGVIGTSRVTNWIKHRDDTVYKIKTTSGKIVRANKRHPFLVDRAGVRSWVRVRDLRVGDRLVETAPGQPRQKDCAPSATSASCTQKDVSAVSPATATGESGAVSRALRKAAGSLWLQKGYAALATTLRRGAAASTGSPKPKNGPATSSTGTASPSPSTTPCWLRKAAAALFARSHQRKATPAQGSSQSCTSITATEPSVCAGSCAITATWQSGTQSPNPSCLPLPHTYEVTTAAIVEIVEDGFEPVFDMEVARTENFIANGVVSHNTRWGKKDPIGRALAWAQENPDSAQWNEIRFPAVMRITREGEEKEVSLWPEQWPIEQLQAKRAGMQPQFWAAQYMQEPTAEEGALIKRDWWRVWQSDRPPQLDYVLVTVDTAHETKTHSDFSVFGIWGVFFNEESERNEIILLDKKKGRWEFPELKKKAFEVLDEWQPDTMLIEKKAAGAPLIQELRQSGIFVEESSPSRGKAGVANDKRARVNAVAGIVEDGCCWIPDKRWAWELVEECASFPNGEHDDEMDVTEMALSRFRRGGFIALKTDKVDDNDWVRPPRREAYY